MKNPKHLLHFLALLGVVVPVLFGQAGRADAGRGVMGLMPVPEKMIIQPGRFRIDKNLTISSQGPASSRAFKATARFMSRLSGRTGLFIKQDFLEAQPASTGAGLVCQYLSLGKLQPYEDESYSLTVSPAGVVLAAQTDIGLLRGLETLLQLLSADEAGYYFPCVEIQDRPRFTWRGLLIDSGRHFQPVDVIKRNLEAMAAVKMNVLHWHLTEDQGFRLESKTFPRLHQAGSDGQFYTQAQVKEVIDCAAALGIRVMPEFDIPGHSTSWLIAYPQYASAPGPYSLERHFGVFRPTFNPADERVYSFFDKFFKEMAGLFPDAYFHIGGDEVDPGQWQQSASIQAFMKDKGLATGVALQAYFNSRIQKILEKYGKKMVGWDEIFEPGLPADIVIQSWRGAEALVESAGKGYQGILSAGYYLDLCRPAAEMYLNDPVPAGSPLTDAQKGFILGGEAAMWGELVTPETIDSRIWPRTAAVAERLWSPQSVNDVDDAYRRMGLIGLDLEELGITHFKNQDMMLRRLAGTTEVQPLKVLAEAAEPLKDYDRRRQSLTYTTLSPFTRFADACFPESLAARAFGAKVDNYLKSKNQTLAEELIASLERWKNNHPLVLPLIAASPSLREVETLSQALEAVAGAGLQALGFLTSGTAPESGWLDGQRQVLSEALKPKAECQLAIIAAVERLVEACAGATE